MGDFGIDPKKVAPQDPQLAKLHVEEQFFECRARIVGLKRTTLTLQTDIQQKQAQIAAVETEIRRPRRHCSSKRSSAARAAPRNGI